MFVSSASSGSTVNVASGPHFADSQGRHNETVSSRVRDILDRKGITPKGNGSFVIAMREDGVFSVTGNHIKNGHAIAEALNGDEKLIALMKQADKEVTVRIVGESPGLRDGPTLGDTLDISEKGMAISKQLDEPSEGIPVSGEPIWSDVARIGAYLGIGLTSDMNLMFKTLSLFIEIGQKDLQETITAILQENGIELSEGEKLDLEVNADGNIKVLGIDHEDRKGNTEVRRIEDEGKIAAIEEALAGDETLGKDLLRLRAKRVVKDAVLSSIVINSATPDEERMVDLTAELEMSDLAQGLTRLDLATQRFLLEDYLQQEAGMSLDALSYSEGRLLGGNEKLEELTAASPALTREIADLITEGPDEMQAEFSLRNGTLVDKASVNSHTVEEKLFLLANREGLAEHPMAAVGGNLLDALLEYNKSAMNGSGQAINDFSVVIGQRGHVSVEENNESVTNGSGEALADGFADVRRSLPLKEDNESVTNGVILRLDDVSVVAGERGETSVEEDARPIRNGFGPRLDSAAIVNYDRDDMSIEGDFASGEKLHRMSSMIESWFTEAFNDVAQAVVGDLLNLHAAEHGDVDDYEHEVVLEVNAITGITTDIRSEEADRAARNDIGEAAVGMSEVITSFLKEELSTQRTEQEVEQLLIQPIEFSINGNGLITSDIEAIEDDDLAKLVTDIVAGMNERMKSEEDGIWVTELSVELLPALDFLRDIRDHMDRFHSDDLRHVRWTSFTTRGELVRDQRITRLVADP